MDLAERESTLLSNIGALVKDNQIRVAEITSICDKNKRVIKEQQKIIKYLELQLVAKDNEIKKLSNCPNPRP
jgi:hypothetical protein